MSNTTAVLLGALLGAIPPTIAAIVAYRKLRSDTANTDANTTKTIVEASGEVIEQLRAEQKRQAAEMAWMRVELRALDRHVDELEQIMRDAGLTPPPRPIIPREEPT